MKLNPNAFNSFIQSIGTDVQWYRSYDCPCINVNTRAPKPNCTLCFGKGVVWNDPIDSKIGFSKSNLMHNYGNFAEYLPGDIVVTIGSDSPAYAIKRLDKILLINSIENFSTVLLNNGTDRLNFKYLSIDGVKWIVNNELSDGVIPTVNENGSITWGLDQPPVNAGFTIYGTRQVEYFMYIELSRNRPFHNKLLPKRVVLRRFDAFSR